MHTACRDEGIELALFPDRVLMSVPGQGPMTVEMTVISGTDIDKGCYRYRLMTSNNSTHELAMFCFQQSCMFMYCIPRVHTYIHVLHIYVCMCSTQRRMP